MFLPKPKPGQRSPVPRAEEHAPAVSRPPRKVAIIVSHGGLDQVLPGRILASGARQAGIDCLMFFTFWGLDAVLEKKVDHLHVNMAGNPSSPMPTIVAGLPGMESMAARMMGKKLEELNIPAPREFVRMLDEMGCELCACELAMKFMDVTTEDLLPQVKGMLTVGDFYDRTEGAQILST